MIGIAGVPLPLDAVRTAALHRPSHLARGDQPPLSTSIRSFQAHYKRGAVDMKILRRWWRGRSYRRRRRQRHRALRAGTACSRCVRLRRLFGGVRVSSSRARAGSSGDDLPKGSPLLRVYGFCVGILSTLMGIGGGQLFSNLLMTFYGCPIHNEAVPGPHRRSRY